MKSGIAPDCTGVMESNPIIVRVSSLPIQYIKKSINNSTQWIGLTGSLHFVTERRLQGTPCASCVGQMGHRSCCGRKVKQQRKLSRSQSRNSKSSKSHDIRCQASSFFYPLAVSLLFIVFLKQIKYWKHSCFIT